MNTMITTIPIFNDAVTSNTIHTTAAAATSIDDLLDQHAFNCVTVSHKVASHELLKLKAVAPTYVEEIKENLAKNSARDIVKKMTFTKKHDVDSDVHHFIGRVWVFTNEELIELLKKAKNAK